MKSKKANFCITVYLYEVNEFFQKGMIFLENYKNWISFKFTKTHNIRHMIKSLFKSMCGLHDFRSKSHSYNRSNSGSSADNVRFTYNFSLILSQCTISQLFIACLLYFTNQESTFRLMITFLLLLTNLGLLEKFF